MKRPVKCAIGLTVLALLAIGVGAVFFGGEAVAYESPDYQVTSTIGDVEIREYAPYLVAETAVEGTLESAGNLGFRILAKYIFGANRAAEKVSMTSPVTQEKAESTNIEMTAPVTQERSGDRFTVRFMMPSKYSRDTLPTPTNPRVRIREVPAWNLAAIRYSGTWSKRNYEEHLDELYETLRSEGLEPVGQPIWARYNPPFTPWFLRRNEILTAFRATASH